MRDYDLDITALAISSMPPEFQKEPLLSYVRAALKPLERIKSEFLALVDRSRYRLNLSGRVIDLEHYLNDLFDETARRIYIEDSQVALPPIMYTKAEGIPIELRTITEGGGLTFYSQDDFDVLVDFIIWVPTSILTREDEIRAYANHYVSAGRRYVIKAI